MEDKLVNNSIIDTIKEALNKVVEIEGGIKSANVIGNSIYIRFLNGCCYIQPLISKYTDGVTLDTHK